MGMICKRGVNTVKEANVRKNIRLKGYDYSSVGYYFITICVKDKHETLWTNPVGAAFGRPSFTTPTPLSEIGALINSEIQKIEDVYESVRIDKYVIMPNHIHMIIVLTETTGEDGRPQAAPTISRIINQFKGSVTKRLGFSIWQKLFHDRVIRDEAEYHAKWQYIEDNPVRWADDEYYT